MLKKTITFEDFDGNEVTEDHYFHLSKADLIEMEVSEKGGLEETITKIVAEEDGKRIVDLITYVVQKSYGERSEDGKRFIKNDDIWEKFKSSEAFSELMVSLYTDADASAAFMRGVIPESIISKAAESLEDDDPRKKALIKAQKPKAPTTTKSTRSKK